VKYTLAVHIIATAASQGHVPGRGTISVLAIGGFAMKKGTIAAALAVVLAIGGAVAYMIVQNNSDSQAGNNVDTTSTLTQDTTEPKEVAVITDKATATLIAQAGYTGSGEATRGITNGTFMHEVTVTLDAPADGTFYEGWLVDSQGFMSTGKMTKEGEGQYSLSYSNADVKLVKSHDKVVVTEETEANGLDNKPEAHVVEGTF